MLHFIAFSLAIFKSDLEVLQCLLQSFRNSNTDGDSPIRLKRPSLTGGEGDEDDGFLDLLDQEVSEVGHCLDTGRG